MIKNNFIFRSNSLHAVIFCYALSFFMFFCNASIAFDFADFGSITVNGKKTNVLEAVGLGNKEEAGSNNDPAMSKQEADSNNDPAMSKQEADSNNSPANTGITRVAEKGTVDRPKWCDEEEKKYEDAQENYDRLRAQELKSIPTFSRDASTTEIIAAMDGSPKDDLAQKRSQEALVKLNKATRDWHRAKDRCMSLRNHVAFLEVEKF